MAYRKRFRRYRSHSGSRRLHPLAIVGICIGGAVLLALIVGNLLRLWLDDEKLATLQSTKPPAQTEEEPLPERSVPTVHAYPFRLGNSMGELSAGNLSALSLSLNTPTGELLYSSQAAAYLGVPSSSDTELTKALTQIYTTTPISYISGVFYAQAMQQESDALRYAVAAEEAALLHEFAAAGGSEVVVMGLSLAAQDLPQTLAYLEQLRQALGNTPLGIAVPFSVAATAQGWELLPELQKQASFLLLDAREDSTPPEQLLINANYYLVSYQMRLLLDATQTDLLNLAISTLSDVQITESFPKE